MSKKEGIFNMAYKHEDVTQVEVNELLEAFEKNDDNIVLLDVREYEEFNAGHIPGVQLIPTSQFVERYEAELDQEKEYIVICRSGNRSQMVCKYLHNQGFKKLANYAGGMLEWIGPVETGDLPENEGKRWK
jgi:rhodanese-related sulfurtransferase